MREKRPDFFVVGAPKSATSSLYHYMQQHPDVFVPPEKEPHFFSFPEVAETYYKVSFVTTEAEYLRLYEGRRDERVAGDFSPSYLFYPQAAQRIKAFQPNAKILILLRNPIKRAISHYLMDIREGYTKQPLGDFLEPTRENKLFYREYVELGMYSEQLEVYMREFGRSNVLVLLYDDLVRDPREFMATIFTFLAVDANSAIDLDVVHNAYGLPRSDFVRRMVQSRYVGKVRPFVPTPLRRFLKKVVYTRKRPDVSREEKRLASIYRAEIDRLSVVLDRDMSAWRLVNDWPSPS